jgi:acyl-CoA thioester hydrolase
LNFCERARSELFFAQGLSPHEKTAFFVVKNIEANYIKPALMGDELTIKTTLTHKKSASLVFLQEIFRDDEKLFIMNVKVAYLKKGKPSKIPLELFELFE